MFELLDKNQKLLIGLLSAGIRNKPFSVENGAEVDWQALIRIASEQDIITLIYGPLAANKSRLGIPGEMLEKLRTVTLGNGAEQERDYIAVGSVLSRFVDNGIQAIPLKGLVLRALYPEPGLRTMSDYDLLVKACDMAKAGRILTEAGYTQILDVDKHVTFSHAVMPMIELHRTLAPAGQFKNYEAFEEQVWKNTEPSTVGGVQVLSPNPVDMEVYQVIHMASHMIDGGFGLRQLCDFVLYTEANESAIDWEEFHIKTSSLQIELFAEALFQLCRLLFGLELHKGLQSDASDLSLMKSIVEDIFNGGVFGKSSNKRIAANRMLYYSGGKEPGTFMERVLLYVKFLFPRAERLNKRYLYAKKNRLLLPFAWVHRFFYGMVRRDIDIFEKTAAFTSAEPASISESRSRLLRELGLLK